MVLSKYSILEQLFQVLKNMIFELPSFFTLQKSIDKRLVQDIVKLAGDKRDHFNNINQSEIAIL